MLVKELQSLCLDVRVLSKDMQEIELRDDDEDDAFAYMHRESEDAMVIDEELAQAGFAVEEPAADEAEEFLDDLVGDEGEDEEAAGDDVEEPVVDEDAEDESPEL